MASLQEIGDLHTAKQQALFRHGEPGGFPPTTNNQFHPQIAPIFADFELGTDN